MIAFRQLVLTSRCPHAGAIYAVRQLGGGDERGVARIGYRGNPLVGARVSIEVLEGGGSNGREA